ncbi:putative prolyl 4-hydroxylase 10 [Vitis vinifera]|uniref:Putative prolyl 4-hydroxylase 10 n=1 Tax=Vitis vinifera TaxID=29760 RepID=A0A438K698_VITVI|nr:putative prolyl 4-hydroxylase 10 [Vitis vinifera]
MAKPRYPRFPPRKSSSSTVVLSMLLMFSFVVLVLLALGLLSIPSHSGDSPRANDLSTIVHRTVERSDGNDGKGEPWSEVISWEPRAFVYHNFLSKDECEYLIKLAKPHMQKSTVVDSSTGKSKDSRYGSLRNFFLVVFRFRGLFSEHGEGLQILHYEVGQKYEPHYDYFLTIITLRMEDSVWLQFLCTSLMLKKGGETVFPAAKGNFSSVPWWNELSECGKEGLSVKPKMGDALLFWSMKPDASLDPSSLHGGCPVIKGNKWSSTKWIRVNEYKI